MQPDRKKTQYIVIGVLVALVVAMFVVMNALMKPPPGLGANTPEQVVDETIISDRTSNASPEMSWIRTGRIEMERLRKSLEEQANSIKGIQDAHAKQLYDLREDYDAQLEQQILEITRLKEQLAMSPAVGLPQPGQGPASVIDAAVAAQRPVDNGASAGSDFIKRRSPARNAGVDRTSASVKTASSGFGQSFQLAALPQDDAEIREIKHLSNYLPAGSYAPAIVLTGADAATNVATRDNPIPVLFRIIGPAVTAAARGRGSARVNLKGCTVQGSATGDLSSERVKVRLLTMTCLNRRGEVLETKVSGYMSGSGKEGVRGHVVSREGPAVKNALVAGLLGGAASALESAGGASLGQENAGVSQILQGAGLNTVAGGAESAASTLAEYYIQRAEQYQPVVSLYGGTKVELVFLEGVELAK